MKTRHIAKYVENFLHPILQILNALINFHTRHVFTVKNTPTKEDESKYRVNCGKILDF